MSSRQPEPTTTPGGHPREFVLEQVAFEPEAVDAGVRRHVEGCEACGKVVAGFQAERRGFLEEHPTRPVVAHVVERAEQEATKARPAWLDALLNPRWLLVSAVTAAALVLVLNFPKQSVDEVTFKGDGAVLQLFLARGTAEARPFDAGTRLRPGDLLRFGVIAPGGRHAFVASVDEAGRFSRYYPPDAGEAAPLDGGSKLQLLPGSIVLDETLGREWIVLLVSGERLDEARVRKALLQAWRAREGDRLGALGLEAQAAVVPVTKAPP